MSVRVQAPSGDLVRKAVCEALGEERGRFWLMTPNRSLGCVEPQELIGDPIGAQMVLQELRDCFPAKRSGRP